MDRETGRRTKRWMNLWVEEEQRGMQFRLLGKRQKISSVLIANSELNANSNNVGVMACPFPLNIRVSRSRSLFISV